MALLGFKKQFAEDVRTGKKRQTIRAKRKHPIKVGERLYHYTGLRQPGATKLRESDATSVETIKIVQGVVDGDRLVWVNVGGTKLLPNEIEELAIADGFKTSDDFLAFFLENHGNDFVGDLIKWNPDAFVPVSSKTSTTNSRK